MLPLALTDTAAVSIVGIVVSGVIGPGVAAHSARTRQRSDHEHEGRQRRHDDLAQLLDEAARVLAPGASRLRAIAEGDLDQAEVGGWSTEVHATYERLLLRLATEDPVAVAYLQAREALLAIAQAFDNSRPQPEINAAMDLFETARSNYLNRARERLSRETDK